MLLDNVTEELIKEARGGKSVDKDIMIVFEDARKHIENKDKLADSKESIGSKLSYFEEHCGGWI